MLRITDVKAFTVQSNFEWGGFIRIYAGDLYGTGETAGSPLAINNVIPYVRKLLIGEDALKRNRILEKLKYAFSYSGTTVYFIISAIDIALHDLIGKYLNIPVWRLIGGDRDEVRVYVDAHASKSMEIVDAALTEVFPDWIKQYGDKTRFETERMSTLTEPMVGRISTQQWNKDYTPENYAERAREIVNEGFTAVKFDLDIPTPYLKDYNSRSGQLSLKDIDYLTSIVKAVREAVGDEIDLMFDLHWKFNINTAAKICKALEPYRPRWIEDPTSAFSSLTLNMDEINLVTQKCCVPIATGENLFTYYQFKDLLKTGISIWTPDLTKAGGITEGVKISELASLFDIEISPHNIASPIGAMAAAHAMSVANTFGGVLEWHAHDLPFWNDIVKPKRRIIDRGFIRLTDEPGLGIDLDMDAMKKIWSDFEI